MDGFIYQRIVEPDSDTYKFACEYKAKTEMYDRTLTHARSRWDETEAFVDISPRIRKLSREYEVQCRKYFTEICGGSWQPIHLEIQKHHYYTAQQWINEYNRLKEVEKNE